MTADELLTLAQNVNTARAAATDVWTAVDTATANAQASQDAVDAAENTYRDACAALITDAGTPAPVVEAPAVEVPAEPAPVEAPTEAPVDAPVDMPPAEPTPAE